MPWGYADAVSSIWHTLPPSPLTCQKQATSNAMIQIQSPCAAPRHPISHQEHLTPSSHHILLCIVITFELLLPPFAMRSKLRLTHLLFPQQHWCHNPSSQRHAHSTKCLCWNYSLAITTQPPAGSSLMISHFNHYSDPLTGVPRSTLGPFPIPCPQCQLHYILLPQRCPKLVALWGSSGIFLSGKRGILWDLPLWGSSGIFLSPTSPPLPFRLSSNIPKQTFPDSLPTSDLPVHAHSSIFLSKMSS